MTRRDNTGKHVEYDQSACGALCISVRGRAFLNKVVGPIVVAFRRFLPQQQALRAIKPQFTGTEQILHHITATGVNSDRRGTKGAVR